MLLRLSWTANQCPLLRLVVPPLTMILLSRPRARTTLTTRRRLRRRKQVSRTVKTVQSKRHLPSGLPQSWTTRFVLHRPLRVPRTILLRTSRRSSCAYHHDHPDKTWPRISPLDGHRVGGRPGLRIVGSEAYREPTAPRNTSRGTTRTPLLSPQTTRWCPSARTITNRSWKTFTGMATRHFIPEIRRAWVMWLT